jgi:hypothetical protein
MQATGETNVGSVAAGEGYKVDDSRLIVEVGERLGALRSVTRALLLLVIRTFMP